MKAVIRSGTSWRRSSGMQGRWVAALLLFAALPHVEAEGDHAVSGLRPGVPFGDYLHREYGTDDGLPSNWIHALHQSRDGYIWIGTHRGVVRFDGHRFAIFDTGNTPQLPSNDTRSLGESRDGTLWIGTTRGLARHRPGRPGSFEDVTALAGFGVFAIHEDRSGTVWVGTAGGLWSGAGGMDFRLMDGEVGVVRAITEDDAGVIWAGSGRGLFRHEGGRLVEVAGAQLPDTRGPNQVHPRSGVWALHHDDRGLWVGTSFGLLLGRGEHFEYQTEGIDRSRLHAILRSRSGTLYVAGRSGLFRSTGSTGAAFESLPSGESVNCLLEDREGGLWLGHAGRWGLHRYQNGKTGALLTDRTVLCVQEDRDAALWFGCDSGLVRLAGGTLSEYGPADGLPDVLVRSIARGRGDVLWLGTRSGVARWSAGRISTVDDPPDLVGMSVVAAHEDAGGALWLARLVEGTFTLRDGVLDEIEALGHGETKWFHEDAEGRLWIGHQFGLFRRDAGGLERIRDPALARLPANFFCHYAAPNGDLWLGTGGGIARHRAGRFATFTVRDGLSADYIQRMHGDRDGRLWLGGRHGFFYVELAELDDFAAGRVPSVTSHATQQDYGMSLLAGGHSTPTGCVTSDGTLLIAAGRGVMTVTPGPLPSHSVPPPVHIEQVRVDGRTVESGRAVALASGPHRLSIDLSIPFFSASAGVRVRYRLEGYDDWIDAGTERVVQYTDLPPGDYSFRVIAANEDGVWNEEGATLAFDVIPRWWELTWLRVAALIAFLGSTAVYLRYRTRGIRRRNAALQSEIAERMSAEEEARQHWDQLARVSRAASMGEITTSIAHEVKQPLFAIVSNAQAATRLMGREPPDREEILGALEDISSDGARASGIIDHIRSLVRKEHEPTEELDLSEVAREAIRLVDPEIRRRDLSLETDLAGDLPAVKGDPIELQQVIINLILNGVQAMDDIERGRRALKVTTCGNNGSVRLSVADRGAGLDEEQHERLFEPFFTTKPQGTGMGLAMNRAIIERHGGQIRGATNEAGGATFEFDLPVAEGDPS